tara:strand:+ start:64 stop:216 length:153 start_codon:yes stop_codon:yes gene_type:complete
MVLAILNELKKNEVKTLIMVEQNFKKELEFADIVYVLVSVDLTTIETRKD